MSACIMKMAMIDEILSASVAQNLASQYWASSLGLVPQSESERSVCLLHLLSFLLV